MTTAHESTIAAAFADRLPTAAPTTVRPAGAAGDSGEAVIASAVGEASADIAVLIYDTAVLADGAEGAPLTERLHTALDAASDALGYGVLSEPALGDATPVFADPAAEVFDLVGGSGTVIGRIAVRVKGSGKSAAVSTTNLDRIGSVELELTVEVGHTRKLVREVMGMRPGQIIELDRSAGAPADVKVNGKLVALGEIVVVDQDYAVRITRIVSSNKEG